jgi:hypothetical protein
MTGLPAEASAKAGDERIARCHYASDEPGSGSGSMKFPVQTADGKDIRRDR